MPKTDQEIISYLARMYEHFGVTRFERLQPATIIEMLDQYDEIEPVTQEEADSISAFIIRVLEKERYKQN
jgi:hypothetical protein